MRVKTDNFQAGKIHIRTFIFQKNLKKHLTNCAMCAILDNRADNMPEGFCEICIYFPLSGFDFYLFLELQLVRRTAVETYHTARIMSMGKVLQLVRRTAVETASLSAGCHDTTDVATRTPHGG